MAKAAPWHARRETYSGDIDLALMMTLREDMLTRRPLLAL
jgi:hypothetical protein